MFCPKCGQELAENSTFCSECGTLLSTPSAQQPIIVQQRTSFMETRSMDIEPYMEEDIIKIMEDFGWQVQNSQRVYSKDSHNEVRDYGTLIGIKTVTETTDFIKITFSRDRAMPHYSELKKLNDEYEALVPFEYLPEPERDMRWFSDLLFWPTTLRTIKKYKKDKQEIEAINETRYEQNQKIEQKRERLRELARAIPKF